MSKYEISSCINDWIFSYSALEVEAENKKEAVMEYLRQLKEVIDEQDSSNLDWILEKADDCIWEIRNDTKNI